MPFLFKLSKRVARTRCAVLLLSTAALAACEKPVKLADPGTGIASRLLVSPKVLILRQNQGADFVAVGLTSAGDTANVALRWTATRGSISETSTNNGRHYGRYQAGSDTGKVEVVATGGPGEASDTAVVTVTLARVSTVAVSPAAASILVGATQQLSAVTEDSAGNVLTGPTVTWTSSNETVAAVNVSGLVTGLVVGAATITATSEGSTGTAAVTVSSSTPPYTLGNGKNYYASPTGSDANPCTAAAPCYTMARVSQLLQPGDNAHFASGTYTWSWSANKVAKSGTASAPITYISDTKWGARIYGPTCAPIYNDGDYVQIINFDVTTGTCPDGIITNGNYSKVIGNRVHDLPGSSGGAAGILGDCCYYNRTGIQIIGNVVDNVGPLGQTNLIHGIYLGGPNGVIVNNIVTRASAACIHLYHGATRTIISNNVVANCGRYGILVSADRAITTNDYTTVNNNIVVNTPGRGIYEYPAVGCHNVYNNNVVYNNAPNVQLICGTPSGTITLTSAQFSALFVNYTGDLQGDYRLRSGAVGIDAGATTCAAGVSSCVPVTDFVGVPRSGRGTALDIGAYEH